MLAIGKHDHEPRSRRSAENLPTFAPRLGASEFVSGGSVGLSYLMAPWALGLHLHQVGRRTCTSKLLHMPSTRLNRFASVDRRSWHHPHIRISPTV
jgi:hypothetical protein